MSLVALVGMAGCATPGTGPRPDAPLPVTVRRTGGIAGVDQVLVVRPDGRWRWAPGRHGASRTGRLAPEARRTLARLAGRGLPTVPATHRRGPGGPSCADGFGYSVRVGTGSVTWYGCGRARPHPAADILALLSGSTPL